MDEGAGRAGALGDRVHKLVPEVVSERIVDPLEMIEIEKHWRERRSVSFRRGQHLHHPVAQQAPVGQAGQRVEIGQFANFLFGLFLCRNIHHRADGGRLAVVAGGRGENMDGEGRSVLAPGRDLVFLAPGAVLARFHLLHEKRMVMRRRQVERPHPVDHFFGRVAEQVGQERIDVFEQAILEHIDADLRRLGRCTKMRLRIQCGACRPQQRRLICIRMFHASSPCPNNHPGP